MKVQRRSNKFRQETPSNYDILVIGASWGGIEALSVLMSQVPPDFPLSIVVIQHQHPHANSALAQILSRVTALPVIDVEDKDEMKRGVIYIAPANYHLLIESAHSFSLSLDAPVKFCRPAVDVTFISASAVFGRRCIGLVLTGANDDGADGVKSIKAEGGYVIAQDPNSAIAPIMPQSAIDTGCVDKVLPLNEVIPHVLTIIN